jgi:hypothetical protein
LGVFITHTIRVLKPNLEDLFLMRQIFTYWGANGAGWLAGGLQGEAELAATAGGIALLSNPQ